MPQSGMGTTDRLVRWRRANGVEFALIEGRAAQPLPADAPLVLCLHGFPDTAWSFVPVLDRLAATGLRAVAPFMRGYAPTSLAADGDYSMLALGRDVLALIEALGAQRAWVVGHDWGALAAYSAAAQQPQRIAGLVTAAIPHPWMIVTRARLKQLRRSRYIGYFQLRGLPERRIPAHDFRWLRALIREWSPGWDFSEEDFAPLRAMFSDPARLAAALAYYRAIPPALADAPSWRTLMRPLSVPARVIRGLQDGCMGPELFERQERCFTGGYELITLADAGHFMQCERPEAFAGAVTDFVGGARKPA